MENGSMARIHELIREYNDLKHTAGGLIYFITTPAGKSFYERLEEIKSHYEDPTLSSNVNQDHIGTLETTLPVVRKDIEKLSEERGL